MGKTTDTLDEMAFSFIRVAPRPVKPRDYGMTIVADRGVGLHAQEDLMHSAGDFVDMMKIGIGAFRLQTEQFLREKIEHLHKHGVEVFFAGDITEAAFLQGQSAKFYEKVKELGSDAVEVSSAQVSMSIDDKCRLIKMATDAGLKVVAETGQKGHDNWTNSLSYINKQIESYFEAGAWKTLIQGEGVSEGVQDRKEDLMLNIAAAFDVKNLIFQAKDGGTQAFYVNTLGNIVNLDVDYDQVIDLELMRRNIRKHGLFGLVARSGH